MSRLAILLGLAFAAALTACGTTVEEIPDLNLVNLQCRAPSACYRTDCDCRRATFEGCLVCDPATATTSVCDCNTLGSGVGCTTEVNVCVARGALCTTRCVAFSGSCSTSAGTPPQTISVPTDGGAALETRCPYIDDVCCP